MTDAELDELERVAKAATPGPWECEDRSSVVVPATRDPVNGYVYIVCDAGFDNASFIAAANPQVVLALVAELRTARSAVERVGTVTMTAGSDVDSGEAVVAVSARRWKEREDALAAFANVARRALESNDRWTKVPTLEWEEALRLMRAAGTFAG